MFDLKPDYEKTKQRIEAFWERGLLDRPVVMFPLVKPPEERLPLPAGGHASIGERWLDIQYQAELALVSHLNQEYLGDTLPISYPNLGPEVFSSFYGCPLHFGEDTSWSDPILHDWNQVDQIQMDWNHPNLKWLQDMTDALLEIGKGKFITGMADWHPGGDAVAAFRDPQRFALDMIEHRQEVKLLLARVERDYFRVYDLFYEKLKAAGLPITSWTPLLCDGRYYIPSNDFSIMISKAMYEEVFLPGIMRECQFLDRSIYHLDGIGALRHLDSILGIPELDALQWVPGAGNEDFRRWIGVYQRVQAAHKGIQVNCRFDEIEAVMESLDPHGLFLYVTGVPDRQAGLGMLKRLEKWSQDRSRGAAG